jgi:hypothetical protein
LLNLYKRPWRDLRNAAGFAAQCARLALPFYEGDRGSDLMEAIEVAEAYSRGEQKRIDVISDHASRSVQAVGNAMDYRTTRANAADYDTEYAARAALAAVMVAHHAVRGAALFPRAATNAVYAAFNAANYANAAGVDHRQILNAFVTWWAQDWGFTFADAEHRNAVLALLAIDEEAEAIEVARGA